MIYLDYQATTPLAPEAREAMLPWLGGPDSDHFGNPHSQHRMGRMAAAAVDLAREQVAALFPPGGQLVFTGSATEALNLAMRMNSPVRRGERVVVSAIEHAAVLDTASAIGDHAILPVTREGLVDLEQPMPERIGLLAIMQVNNEIGTIQPVAELARRAKAENALVLCDAVQAAGRMPLAEADMIAISAHKIHGPKGIGALWVREGVALAPLIEGGGQEQGLRSGTLSPALCAGFGAAVKLSIERFDEDRAHVERLWDLAIASLRSRWTINGSVEHRYKGNLNIRREGIDAARLISELRDIAFSLGSACASGSGRPSHVLKAIGLTDREARSSIRIGFGRYTTEEELLTAIGRINEAADAQEQFAA